ncbi:MAG TPA: tetratricopeptide repeat protein, partial [Fibrobacteria bacterium]|nr:tetratricopeptide repeat protein [Fibrobacteria bacterium]
MTIVHRNRLPLSARLLVSWIRQALPLLGILLVLGGAGVAEAAPTSAEEWYKQADGQYQEGSVEEAIKSLEEALKLKPDYLDALVMLGNAHVENGDFAKAAVPLKRASQIKPGDYAILLNYSNALEGAGRGDEQLPVLKSLFNLNKSDLVTGIKYLTLIEAAGREKYVEDYIFLLEELRKTPNADPNYTAKLARAYNKTGKSDLAIKAFNELLSRNPESGEYWAGLAAAQAKVDRDAAKESFRKAILYTDAADERARLEKALTSLGSAPAATPAAPVAPAVDLAAKAKAEADAKAKADAVVSAAADKKAKEDAERQAKAEAAAKAATAEAEKKAIAEAEKKAKA